MKSNILTHTIAAFLAAAPIAQADDRKPDEKKDDAKSSSASTSVVTSSDGTATLTIDINGRKETRTFKLGDGNNTFSFSTDGDGAKAAGVVGVGGGKLQPPEKREKGPWLGVAMEPVQDVVRAQLSLAPGEGIVVSHVVPDGPAAKAGLETNDILLRFDDQIIVEPSQLRKLIAMKKPGESVKLAYMRKGERKETNVTLIEHELEPDGKGPMQFLQGIPRWQGGDDAMRRMEEQLKQWKEKRPGILMDKWSWSTDPDGAGPWNRERLKGMIEEMRKHLENSKLPKEEQDRIRKGVEEAMENARKAMEDAMKDLKRRRRHEEQKSDEKPKQPGEPL
ncbi:MAG: PDZ domain-containing protein [Chthoniobacteraceae bacterium]